MTVLRPIRHEDRLSVIDHLDELRTRLFISIGVLFVAFCLCFVFNGQLLDVLNHPLPTTSKTGLGAQNNLDVTLGGSLKRASVDVTQLGKYLSQIKDVPAGALTVTHHLSTDLLDAGKAEPKTANHRVKLTTLGPSEAFTTTLMVVGYFALMITLPVLLFQLYAFVIPALSKDERRVAVPSMFAAPLLFVAGCVFTYLAIMPPAIHFLQGYNAKDFNNLLQAKSYYKFEIVLMMGVGLAFQVPLLLLALQKIGVITASTLTLNWRYATVLIAVIAAALPGVDPVTMLMETLPLVLLYLASIVLLKVVEHRARKRVLAEAKRATQNSDD